MALNQRHVAYYRHIYDAGEGVVKLNERLGCEEERIEDERRGGEGRGGKKRGVLDLETPFRWIPCSSP